MKNTLKYLTQIQPPRNYQNIDSLNNVANYIKNRFESLNLEVSFQEFKVDGTIYKNIIATINPHYSKRLIVGGHYDVCGDFQGADDNASAIAGIIETAKQLKQYEDTLLFRIDFVAFCLEEPPYFGTEQMGSFIHAKYLIDKNIDVIGMINYEMIGYYTDEPNSQDYPIPQMKDKYPSIGNFIANISNEKSINFLKDLGFDRLKKDIDSYDIVLPDAFAHITASDHLNYWSMGFDAVMITDTAYFRNKNYHTKYDTYDTIDFTKMQYAIDMVANSILHLNSTKIDDILKLCAFKWVENCGISSIRTLYWDMAMTICSDNFNKFKEYILACEYGKESLDYDINGEYGLEFYENIKTMELSNLNDIDKKIFMNGYSILVNNIKI